MIKLRLSVLTSLHCTVPLGERRRGTRKRPLCTEEIIHGTKPLCSCRVRPGFDRDLYPGLLHDHPPLDAYLCIDLEHGRPWTGGPPRTVAGAVEDARDCFLGFGYSRFTSITTVVSNVRRASACAVVDKIKDISLASLQPSHAKEASSQNQFRGGGGGGAAKTAQ